MDEARAADIDATLYLGDDEDRLSIADPVTDLDAEEAVVAVVPSASDEDGRLIVLADRYQPAAARSGARAVKRALDIIGSAVLTIALLPVALAIALAIALDSPGPILYRHRRVGRDGTPFSIVKFRTMVRDGDAVLQRALADDPDLRREWQMARKLQHDPRVTRVGRFLRRTSLDELPQVLNVLIGTMSR
jgi:undecaprenyl-phosphate galactose phosphotransferase